MTEHTTIQITKEQADELNARKQYDDEPYKGVIARLLNGDSQAIDEAEMAEALADELKNEISMANEPGVQLDTADIIGRIDDLETTLPRQVADELGAGR